MFGFAETVQYNDHMNRWIVVALSALLLLAPLTGCGADQKLEEKSFMSVEDTKANRELFDKVGGDYDKLTPEDKAAYLKRFDNDESRGAKMWDLMKNGPGGGPSGL